MSDVFTGGDFGAQLNEVERLLRQYSQFQDRNLWIDYAGVDVGRLRILSYQDCWLQIVRERWYDFVMVDGSALQFRATRTSGDKRIDEIHFSYLQSAFDVLPYPRFVREVLEANYAEVGDAYWHEYQQYVDTCPVRVDPIQIRFDYEPRLYTEGCHPAGHFHLGAKNSIRIGAYRIPGPRAFLFFVFRQAYPALWPHVLSTSNIKKLERVVRGSLPEVPPCYRGTKDRAELWLE